MSEVVRIVLLGANGQVGWELQRSLAPLGRVYAFGRSQPAETSPPASDPGVAGTARTVDFLRADALRGVLRDLEPHVIVNAAAYTAVDAAETNEAEAHAVNAAAVGVLGAEAAHVDALLVHYSTDYVFDGSGTAPWTERSATAPLGAYGRSKLAGERAIVASGCRALVFRTSWVYAARGANFIRTMLRLATTRDSLRVVADQHGAPTGAELIADVTAHCVRAALAERDLAGTYHLAAAGETTWHEYALRVVRAARAAGWPVRVADADVAAIPSSEYPTPARRPANSRLDTTAVRTRFGLELPAWEIGVDRVLGEVLSAPPHAPGTAT